MEGSREGATDRGLLESALRMTLSGRAPDDGGMRLLLGLPLVERDVRLALERSYRELAARAQPCRADRAC